MEILTLIDALEDLVVQARRLPVGGNLVLDRKRLLDIIDQLRLAVPDDLRQATQILENRDQILQEASERAAITIRESEMERARQLDETSIIREAEERSQQIIMEAQAQARQTVAEADATAASHLSDAAEAATNQLNDADKYALAVMTRLREQLEVMLESVRTSAEQLGRDR